MALYAALQQAAAFFAYIGVLCHDGQASLGAFHAGYLGVTAGPFCSATTDSCSFLSLSCSIHCIDIHGQDHTTRVAVSAVRQIHDTSSHMYLFAIHRCGPGGCQP
jgi:hypothetical protein